MINANTNIELRNKIIEFALLQYHKEYIHGNMGPDSFDCAGLVWYVYNYILNLNIFDYNSYGLSTTTKIMTSDCGILKIYNNISDIEIDSIGLGDILFFHRQSLDDSEPRIDNKYPGHCGIYLGNNRFIHASRPMKKVVINNFEKRIYWKNVIVGSKDIITPYTLKLKK